MTNYFASKAKINVFCSYFEQRIFKERYIIRTILNYFPKVLKVRYYDKDNKYQIRKEKKSLKPHAVTFFTDIYIKDSCVIYPKKNLCTMKMNLM